MTILIELQRITTEYVDAEDRLRLTGEDAAEQTWPMWVTQRLLRRLLPHLLTWVEQQVRGAVGGHADALRSFAQQVARADLEPQAPVVAGEAGAPWLVVAVDVVFAQEGVVLTFKGVASHEQAAILFAPHALRQWLSIVHDHYRLAEWPVDVWPSWMDDEPAAGAEWVLTVH
jgi:hypothetical protein